MKFILRSFSNFAMKFHTFKIFLKFSTFYQTLSNSVHIWSQFHSLISGYKMNKNVMILLRYVLGWTPISNNCINVTLDIYFKPVVCFVVISKTFTNFLRTDAVCKPVLNRSLFNVPIIFVWMIFFQLDCTFIHLFSMFDTCHVAMLLSRHDCVTDDLKNVFIGEEKKYWDFLFFGLILKSEIIMSCLWLFYIEDDLKGWTTSIYEQYSQTRFYISMQIRLKN